MLIMGGDIACVCIDTW